MYRKIARNVAVVTAVFIVVLSTMIIVNYFQVKGFNPLQTEVVETLKEINDANADNEELREQIRRLDLLARRAYFASVDHLESGVSILIGMLIVFVITSRIYFGKQKDIPGKDVDPIDDWAYKTQARRYVHWVAGFVTVAAVVFAVFSSDHLSIGKKKNAAKDSAAATAETSADEYADNLQEPETMPDTAAASVEEPADSAGGASEAAETEIPKVTHNSFRGNNSSAFSAAGNIPTQWNLNTGENVAWKSDIPRHGFNSPVINGANIFLTGADNEARELFCFDLNTGALRWRLAADNIPGSPAAMPETTHDTGLAASTVTTNGNQVAAIFATGDVICADMEGKRLWGKNLGVPANHYGYASSLLSLGSTLIIQYDNSNSPRLLALDMATGAERWSKSRTDKITWSSPIIAYVDRKPQLILMGNPNMTSYDPGNGAQNWAVQFLSGEVASSPCSAGGLVFGASEYSRLVAVDAQTGEKRWEADDYLPEVSSPAATAENVYVATSYGVIACYDAKSGELKTSHETNTEFYSSPMIVEGKIYLFANSGKAFIYAANGELSPINSFETGQRTFATPAFTDGRMVVRSETQLYCVQKPRS
jgi:outer membrane protein assembly factor BamB